MSESNSIFEDFKQKSIKDFKASREESNYILYSCEMNALKLPKTYYGPSLRGKETLNIDRHIDLLKDHNLLSDEQTIDLKNMSNEYRRCLFIPKGEKIYKHLN